MKNAQAWLWPSLILVALVVVAVLVIQNEGNKTREAMRQMAKEQAEEAKKTVGMGLKDGFEEAKKVPGQVLEGMGGLLGDKPGEAPTKPAEVPGKVLDILGGFLPKAKEKAETKSESEKGEKPSSEEKPQSSVPRERTRPQDVVGKVFQFGREVIKAADDAGQSTLALDAREENELGKEVRETFAKHFKFADRPDQLARIQRLVAPVLERRNRKEIEYTFSIVDNPEMNAFSVLGGNVYVHTGLLDRTPSDAELQGVLAHEIGHVDLKHCVRNFTYAVRTGELGGEIADGLTKIAYRSLSVAYSEDHEFEADEFAYRTLVKARVSREDSLAFTKFLLKAEDAAGVKRDSSRPKNVFDSIGREVSHHYRTHPPATERLRRLEQMKVDSSKP